MTESGKQKQLLHLVFGGELENLQDELKNKLKENGRIFISKDSGLFEAIKQ